MKFESIHHEENKFFILADFDEELKAGIIVPLTCKIEELRMQHGAVIEIYINSDGGDGSLAVHIIHLLELAQQYGITVRTIVMRDAFSAGSLVAVAGTPGERYISSYGEHLIHYGQSYNPGYRSPLQTDRAAARTKRWFGNMLDHYKKYAAIPDLEKVMADDNFFIPAKKCIQWKLADKDILKLC
jgi:ATP-dependent protease ClpP protease subunit